MFKVGAIGSSRTATVDEHGRVHGKGWSLDWWIGTDDRRHFPADDPTVRQGLVGNCPVVETALKVPGGDAIQRVYGIPGDVVVVEVENRSRLPFAVGFLVDGTEATFPRKPGRIDEATGASVFPLAHAATMRIAVGHVTTPLPPSDAVVRGWAVQTSQGMQLDLPPGRLADAVQVNRCYLLLEPDRLAFKRYGHRPLPRRRRRRRTEAADFLLKIRDGLVRETKEGLALCADLPDEWRGQNLDVRDAPTDRGPISFALRWHGERPALLWELDGSTTTRLTAPGLDPAWSATAP